jgi:hypothetical protein
MTSPAKELDPDSPLSGKQVHVSQTSIFTEPYRIALAARFRPGALVFAIRSITAADRIAFGVGRIAPY